MLLALDKSNNGITKVSRIHPLVCMNVQHFNLSLDKVVGQRADRQAGKHCHPKSHTWFKGKSIT